VAGRRLSGSVLEKANKVQLAQPSLRGELGQAEVFSHVFAHPIRDLTKLEAGQRRTPAVGLFNELGIVSCEVDSDCLSDALDEKRTCLSAYQFFVEPFHQPVQIGISEC